ncbi:hypothetical protein Tco_0867596 [Tanacetum coccineum]
MRCNEGLTHGVNFQYANVMEMKRSIEISKKRFRVEVCHKRNHERVSGFFDLYPPDEYLHHFEPSQRYQVDRNTVQFIEPYDRPETIVTEAVNSLDQNDQPFQTDEILNDDQYEHSNHTNGEHIIDNLEDVPNTVPLSSPSKDTSAPNVVSPIQTETPSSIPSMATLAPQDRWSKKKQIELVNIVGNPGAKMLTRAMAKELSADSVHECLFVDIFSEKEPKKVSEALKHPGWVDAMQGKLNQFSRNKLWTLVHPPYGKTIISS